MSKVQSGTIQVTDLAGVWRETRRQQVTIESVLVEKYKSLRDRTEIELRRLTVLAGANSSGKSSIMQPLLLLKQTFEAGFDPGPLLISGPNVVFSETDQMLWSAPGEPRSEYLWLGLGITQRDQNIQVKVRLGQQKEGPTPLGIEECVWTLGQQRFALRETMTPDEIEALVAPTPEDKDLLQSLSHRLWSIGETDPPHLSVERTRAFLTVILGTLPFGLHYAPSLPVQNQIEESVRKVIHVPGLRGNPRRTYPVTAVKEEFPGLFHDYVASVIARWQKSDRAKLDRLGRDLYQLGMTWKVKAEQKSDTEVEIRVGRLPTGRRGGARDLVSIADVGFGVSQSLPVAVALLVARPGQLVYLEQPEIHLHPRAQSGLAELIQRAVERGVQVVVETHSELLLLGLQKMVALGKIATDDALLHWFSRDQEGVTRITTAHFDEQGALGDIPLDFAEVSMTAMREYLEAATPGS